MSRAINPSRTRTEPYPVTMGNNSVKDNRRIFIRGINVNRHFGYFSRKNTTDIKPQDGVRPPVHRQRNRWFFSNTPRRTETDRGRLLKYSWPRGSNSNKSLGFFFFFNFLLIFICGHNAFAFFRPPR